MDTFIDSYLLDEQVLFIFSKQEKHQNLRAVLRDQSTGHDAHKPLAISAQTIGGEKTSLRLKTRLSLLLVLFAGSHSLVPLLQHDYREWMSALPLFLLAMTWAVRVELFIHNLLESVYCTQSVLINWCCFLYIFN